VTTKQPCHNLQSLSKPSKSGRYVPQFIAEHGVLALLPPGADTEHHASAAQVIYRQ
jgi:hypothetical protein